MRLIKIVKIAENTYELYEAISDKWLCNCKSADAVFDRLQKEGKIEVIFFDKSKKEEV